MAGYDVSVGHVGNVAGPGSPPSFDQAPLTGDFTTLVPSDSSSALSSATLALTAATQVGISGFLTDTFTGVDATTLTSHVGETGATWAINSATAGSFDIRSNRVRCVTSPVDYYASGLSSSPDYDAIGTFRVISVNVVGAQLGITGRYDTTTRSGYFLQLNAGTLGAHVWQLVRTDNGTQVVLGSFATTFVANTTYVGTLRQRGTSLTAIIDGIEQISVTDATYATVGTVGLRSGQAAGTATGVHLDSLAAVDLSVVTLGQSSATLNLSVTTGVPLNASSPVASPTLAVTATTQVPLDASSAVASTAFELTPVYIALNAASGVASPTLALTATTTVTSLTSTGQSSATIAASAATQVPLVASSAVASPTLAVTARTIITLAAASASASPTLVVSAQTQTPLGAVTASATDSLSLKAPTQVALAASSAVSSPTLALSATTQVTLVSTSAIANATPLALNAPSIISLATTGLASSTLSLSAQTSIPSGVASSTATDSLTLSATTQAVLGAADSLASGSASLMAATSVALDASAGAASATLATSAATAISLAATAQASATLAVSADAQLSLSTSALSSATMVLIAAAAGVVLIGPATSFTSATATISAQTAIPLGNSSSLASATLVIVIPVNLPLSPVESLSSAIFGFKTPTRLSLSASGHSSTNLALVSVFFTPGYTGTVETMVRSDVKVAIDPDTGQSTAIYISRSVFQPVTLRSVIKAQASRDVSLVKLTSGLFEALQADGPWDVSEDADDLTLSSQQTVARVTNRSDLEDELPVSSALELTILSR